MQTLIWKTLSPAQQADVLTRPALNDEADIGAVVKEIIAAVRSRGDEALRELSQRFERAPRQQLQVSDAEIDFMIETASGYLEKPITRADVKASFAGLRPLFNPQATGSAGSTAKVSREHAVIPEFGNMITVTGGKWTAYRKMAEHAMLVATLRHLIPPRLCVTKDLPIFCDPNWDHAALEIEAEAEFGEQQQFVAHDRRRPAARRRRGAEAGCKRDHRDRASACGQPAPCTSSAPEEDPGEARACARSRMI